MPRIFVDSSSVSDGRVRIGGPDALHLARSLRVRDGETVVVVEAGTREHGVVLKHVGRDAVEGVIAWSRTATGEPRVQSHVLQAVPQRGMDDAVEALSELGATHIHPLLTSRTVSRPDAAAADRRVARWRVIAREAAQLAGRARVPVIHPPRTVAEAVAALPDGGSLLVAAVHGATSVLDVSIDVERPIAVAIGPEGGFDDDETAGLRAAGGVAVHLGARVLPARLAGAIALSLILGRAGDLDAGASPAPKI